MDDINQKIDAYIDGLPDWQAANLRAFRELAHTVAPDIREDWKWNVPFFMLGSAMVFAMSAFKDHTKYNFLGGQELDDKDGLFNSGLDSKGARAIDLRKGESVDRAALERLMAAAVTRVRAA